MRSCARSGFGDRGRHMLAARLAWGDRSHRAAGQGLSVKWQEIGLAKSIRARRRAPVWREILTDRADRILAPLPPRGMRSSAASYPTRPVKIYQQGADGSDARSLQSRPCWCNNCDHMSHETTPVIFRRLSRTSMGGSAVKASRWRRSPNAGRARRPRWTAPRAARIPPVAPCFLMR